MNNFCFLLSLNRAAIFFHAIARDLFISRQDKRFGTLGNKLIFAPTDYYSVRQLQSTWDVFVARENACYVNDDKNKHFSSYFPILL